MKYDLISEFAERLATNDAHARRPATVRQYTHCLENLLKGQDPLYTLEKLDIEKIINQLEEYKYKNHFSQAKNTLFYFLNFNNISLKKIDMDKIDMIETTRKKKYRKLSKIDLTNIDKRLSHIRDTKLKLSYQVMLFTGMRPMELCQITKQNINIKEKEIIFSFIGKGGKKQTIKLDKMDNPKFCELLHKHILENDIGKLFYSIGYLQKDAKKRGFELLDFRRAYAKREYKRVKNKDIVREKMRHKSVKTTNIYLRTKIKI